MKKINKILAFIVIFAICVICGFKKTDVNAASASLTGPGTVRAGDTITLSLNVSAPGSYGFEGSLSYDNSVTLVSMSAGTGGWKLEQNGSKVVVYDDALSNPLGNNSNVINAVFKVNNVQAGTAINVAFNNIVVSDGNNESSIGTAKYSVAVAAPLSGNNNLGSLSIAGHNINFNASQTAYDVGSVEFSESSLNITATPADTTAKVSIGNTALNVGANTISINVTAQNGAVKTYTIKASRKQDPNYKKSNNANLSSITVSEGKLSPAFAPDVTEYVVYVPFETKTISATGTLQDGKGKEVSNGSIGTLKSGENKMSVTGVAEDDSKKVYNITVVVMPEYKGELPSISGVEARTEPETETETETETVKETENTTENESSAEEPEKADGNTKKTGIPVVAFVITAVVMMAAGYGICYVVMNKHKKTE